MELHTAISVFQELEKERMADAGANWHPPLYDVRLDASTDRDDERGFRVRVTSGSSIGGITPDDWRFVLDLADRYELGIDVQNSAMELR